jgi:hypothetical protein
MQQIADWLERLGLSEYAQRFAENDIDVEVLSELTDNDFDRAITSMRLRVITKYDRAANAQSHPLASTFDVLTL